MSRLIMKYFLRTIKNGTCRLGTLSDLRCTETELETPLCMLYTRGGTVPYMTPDMVAKLKNRPQICHIPLTWIAEHHETLKEFGQGIEAFASLQNQLIYCSLQDPATLVPSGYNDKSGVGVWGKGGKLLLDAELFMRVQESCQPDWYQALSDGDTNDKASKKRSTKAVDRTLRFLDECLERHNKSQRLEKTAVLGVIEGGYDVKLRIRSAKETAARNVQGFVIEGFHNMGAETEKLDFKNVQDVLKKTLDELPEDKPRILHGAWSPRQVLEAIMCGVDVFDSSYPYIVTERDCALTFSYDYRDCSLQSSSSTVNECQILNGSTTSDTKIEESRSPGEINLADKRYYDDFDPIVRGCECYTCQRFSRAYINHLVTASELLSRMLLIMHNMHHYIQFFEAIRNSLREDKFDDLKKCIICTENVNIS